MSKPENSDPATTRQARSAALQTEQELALLHDRTAAKKLYASATGPEDLRDLCLHDLFFLMVYGCGRKDMDNDWCFARCREVQRGPDGYLDLWAREHYKSTIITVGLTLQDIMRNPEITVGIFSHSRPIARAFLRQIKRECEANTLLRELFPHICPPGGGNTGMEGQARRTWSEEDGLVMARRTNPKEATVEAWGLVDGQPTGKHFSLLVYDDIVTRESVTTPLQIARTTEAWELSLNLGAKNGTRRMIGTRYHHFDTWQTIMDRGAAIPRIHPATSDGTAGGIPVFLSAEELARKRRDQGPYTFGAQMLQNPTAERTQGFLPEWFKTIPKHVAHNGMHRYIVVDPAGERKKSSDYTVFWVVGLDANKNYHVLDGVRDRLNLTGRANMLFALHQRYSPLAVGYEKYGQQADIEHITDRMAREGYFFSITPLGGAVPKNDRIRKLVPLFEQGRVHFCQPIAYCDLEGRTHDLARAFLQEEFTQFPVSRHDDMLDCLARIIDPALGAVFPEARPGGRMLGGARAFNGFEKEFFG